ncbi:hypothetical protein OS176_00930 [Xanthomonadaceae bacterium XH05]|nr:hypothetical protein [Xanthomonadaceae bacterium XH05]
MRRALQSLVVFSCVALASPGVHADIMVGGMGTPAGANHPLNHFSSLAQGSMLPQRQIVGPATLLHEPGFGVYEPTHQLIYVSDFRGQAIRVYPAFASGDVPPLRVINSPSLGQTRANAPVFAHNELGTISNNCCIATFPMHASGSSITPLRSIFWGGGSGGVTGLNNPVGLIYLAPTDEYAVIDGDSTPPFTTRIVFHHRTSSGDVPPSRQITGPNVANARGLAYDPVSRHLFVLRVDIQPSPASSPGIINVFDDLASGDAVPIREITSNSLFLPTQSHYFAGLGFDPYTQRLMVSRVLGGFPSFNQIVPFSASASGPAGAIQMLEGSQLSGHHLGVPFGVPAFSPTVPPLIAIAHPTTVAFGGTSALSTHGGQGSSPAAYSVTSGIPNCSIQGNTLTALQPGACTVTATTGGSSGIPVQTASISLQITQAPQAALTLITSPKVIPVGGISILSTQGGSGTGAVQYAIFTGSEHCQLQGNTLTGLAEGSCTVYAVKSGDTHYYPTSSEFTTVMVGYRIFSGGFEPLAPTP